KYIYFQSIRDGPLETWVMRADGTDQRALFQGSYYSSREPVTFGHGTLGDPAMPLFDAPNDLVGVSDGSGSNLLAGDGFLATGTAWGDPHFTTYDGVQYDYQGVGDFLLARSTVV